MSWADPILEHGGFLLAGTSAFLALGLLINLLQRAPIQRLRIAELAVGCALAFTILTFAPMPRAFVSEVAPPVEASTRAYDFGPTDALLASTKSELMAPRRAPLLQDLPLLADVGLMGQVLPEDEPVSAATAQANPAPTREVAPAEATPLAPLTAEPEAGFQLPFPVDQGLFVLWLGGAALSALWLFLGALRVQSVLRRSRVAPHPVLQLLRERGIELPARVRLRISDRPVRPFCVGLFRPIIVIPGHLLEDEQDHSLAPVVHHELAHASQRDARGLWLFAVAQVPLWFHPLFWWLRAQHRFATELVADAIAAGNTSNRAYARELVHLVERQSAEAAPVVGATALFRTRSDFYHRMQMLLTRRQPLATRTSLRRRALHSFLGLALLTGATSLGGSTPAFAQEPDQKEQLIADLRAENEQLRRSLNEMSVALTEMRDMLAQMQSNHDARIAEQEAQHDALLQQLVIDNQHAALGALGYLAVEDYVVQAGDTLPSILGNQATVDSQLLEHIQKLNPGLLENIRGGHRIRTLKPGESLRLPLDRPGRQDPRDPGIGDIQIVWNYVVQEGDSMHKIAAKHGLMTRELQLKLYQLNADKFGDRGPDQMHSYPLTVGESLRIPHVNQPEVKTGVPLLQDLPLLSDVFSADPAEGMGDNVRVGVPLIEGRVLDAEGNELRDSISTYIGGRMRGAGIGTPSDEDSSGGGHSTLPPVNLAECMEIAFRAIDMQGELESAASQFEYSAQLHAEGLITDQEKMRDEQRYRTLKRKIGLSHRVVEARIADLQMQIEELASHYKSDHPAFPRREIDARKRAIEILSEGLR